MPKFYDFIVIVAPECWLLRPVSDRGQSFIEQGYKGHKRGIFNTLVFDNAEPFHNAIESLSAQGLRVEVL